MNKQFDENSPIVIGGVGGSGTRLIAGILMDLGYHMGFDLNESLDNLAFTLLFKRTRWYRAKSESMRGPFERGMGIFRRAMIQPGPVLRNPAEIYFALQAAISMYRHGHDHLGSGKGRWTLQRTVNLLTGRRWNGDADCGWGWKEPNSHIYLEWLDRFYPGMKYVLVIRNGLDMAYSANQAQLYNWGFIWGIDRNRIDREPAVASLDYWIQANRRAVRIGNTMGSRKFLRLNYDRLCDDPRRELTALFDFLEAEPDGAIFENAVGKIKPPESIGRYRKYDITQFRSQQIDQVRKMGFDVSDGS